MRVGVLFIKKYLYASLTWPEIDQAAKQGKVIIIPVGTIEDHGPHLPVDTDVVIAEGVCYRVAKLVPEEVLLMPPIYYGYSPHHIDFPGTVTVTWSTFINHTLDITKCLAHHGFKKIILINGHGSNRPVLDLATRLTIVECPDVHCGYLSWWDLSSVREEVKEFRESERTGHACELETSLYLALRPELVKMQLAVKEIPAMSSHFWGDLVGQKPRPEFKNPVVMAEYWSTVTASGICGDPTKASAEKGERILKTAAGEIAEIIREFKNKPILPRKDHHSKD